MAVLGAGQVGERGRRARRPGAAREPGAGREELRDLGGGVLVSLGTAEVAGCPVQAPELPGLPVQVDADALEDARHGLGRRPGLGKVAGDGVMGRTGQQRGEGRPGQRAACRREEEGEQRLDD